MDCHMQVSLQLRFTAADIGRHAHQWQWRRTGCGHDASARQPKLLSNTVYQALYHCGAFQRGLMQLQLYLLALNAACRKVIPQCTLGHVLLGRPSTPGVKQASKLSCRARGIRGKVQLLPRFLRI